MSKKIKKIENFGIPLDENIKDIINDAYSQYNNKSAFADAIGIDRTTACFILGTKTRHAKYISWGKWPKIRDYLASVGLLDASDPRWMTPDELRGDASPAFRQEMTVSSPKRFYFDGVPHSGPSSADFLSRLMASEDIPADVKVLIFQEHEKFLSDYGTKRHDSAQHGTLARFSTERNESNV